jgi:hypothetical protein
MYSSLFLVAVRIALLVADWTLRANAICRIMATAFAGTFISAKCLIDMSLGDPWR